MMTPFFSAARRLRAAMNRHLDKVSILIVFSSLYVFLAWLVCGGDTWWVIDYVDGSNVFYGDDAYRFFLARSAWINADLYTYNFVLPAFLFLDGVVTTLAGGDLFWARAIHGLLGTAALCLVWDSGRLLGINKVIMACAVLLMGLLPRYAMTSLSFYGEAWLGFAFCLLIWFYLRQHFLLVAFVAGLLPLIRPEGLFFMAPFWIFMVKERRWKEAALMVAPGFLYFVYLNLVLSSLQDYSYWRYELRRILNKLVLNRSGWEILDTYSFWLTIPAVLGFLYQPVRRLWPVLLSSAFWVVWLQVGLYSGLSNYEDRYTYVLIPVITLLWASFFAWLWVRAPKALFSDAMKIGAVALCSFFIVTAHVGNMFSIKTNIQNKGLLWTAERMLAGEWGRIFWYYAPQDVTAWKEMAGKIEGLLENDHGIDKLIVFDHVLYYHLNPYSIPKHVTVGYPTNGYMIFQALLDGQVFIQYPGEKMYSYLRYGLPDFRKGERRALYADVMPLKGYPYSWKMENLELHLFSYLESLSPEKDFDQAPMIDPRATGRQFLQR